MVKDLASLLLGTVNILARSGSVGLIKIAWILVPIERQMLNSTYPS